jgi:choline-glycine betaine transporter
VIEKLLMIAALPLVILVAFALASLWTEQQKVRYRFTRKMGEQRRKTEANEKARRERESKRP